MVLHNKFTNEWVKLFYYFIRLPIFRLLLPVKNLNDLHTTSGILQRPDAERHFQSIKKACSEYPFLSGRDPERLFYLYNLVSLIRESDVYSYLFMTERKVKLSNVFHNLDLLRKAYDKGPVLVLYAHTGSYYYSVVATAITGYRVYPIAYNIKPENMERPFRWFYSLNMKLSEKYFNGGYYLYTGTPYFFSSLKRIISSKEKALIYAAIDLPRSFITDKRAEVMFLGKRAAFPDQIVKIFVNRRLPIFISTPSVEIIEGKIKRITTYEPVAPHLSHQEVIDLYAKRLEDFVNRKPEQIITLINLDAFFYE